jgi:hypothetical protein
MERGDLPDKLFAEDTLPHPNSVDGERPAREARQASARNDSEAAAASDDMLAVEYREDEMRTTTDIEDEARPTHGGKTD